MRSGILGWLMLAVMGASPAAWADVRDQAGMFDAATVKQANAILAKVEGATGIPVVVETIPSLPAEPNQRESADAKKSAINAIAKERDAALGNQPVYLLLSAKERLMSNIGVPASIARYVGPERRDAIRDAYLGGFRKGDMNAGLLAGCEEVSKVMQVALAEAGGSFPRPGEVARQRGLAPGGRGARQGGSNGLPILLLIGGVIVVALVLVRALGRNRSGMQHPMGGPGQPMGAQGPGQGPGFGPGYGPYPQRGGGFMSGLLGGLGGAIAGNWIYDQFRGHGHGHGHADYASGHDPGVAGTDAVGNEAVGFEDHGGMGADWGDAGGGDWGGGDFGGGDFGGGGDW
jgi:uncharacterized protein